MVSRPSATTFLYPSLAILLCTFSFSFGQTCDPPCGSFADCVVDGAQNAVCSCWSMYSGPTCEVYQSGNCTDLVNASALETESPPIVRMLEFLGNDLVVEFHSDYVINRQATSITIHDGTGHPACRYPGPFWEKTLHDDECHDVWSSLLPWSQVANCGWNVVESDSFKEFTSILRVAHDEYLGDARGTPVYRVVDYAFPIKVTFQLSVAIQTEVTVYAPIDVMVAITLQVYDPVENIAYIGFVTSLQHPFHIAEANLTGLPPGFEASLTEQIENKPTSCPGRPGMSCMQNYLMEIDATLLCNIKGLYSIDADLECLEEVDGDDDALNFTATEECPIQAGDRRARIELDVVSEDFCADISLDVDLDGTLTSYEDTIEEPYSVPRDSFFIGSDVVFKADVFTVDVGISINSTEIVQVWLSQESGDVFFFDSGVVLAGGQIVHFAIMEEGDSWASFRLKTNPPPFFVFSDASKTFSIYCKLKVTYSGIVYGSNTKREVVVPLDLDSYAIDARQLEGIPIPDGTSASARAAVAIGLIGKYENPEDDPYHTIGPSHPNQNGHEWNSETNIGAQKSSAARHTSFLSVLG